MGFKKSCTGGRGCLGAAEGVAPAPAAAPAPVPVPAPWLCWVPAGVPVSPGWEALEVPVPAAVPACAPACVPACTPACKAAVLGWALEEDGANEKENPVEADVAAPGAADVAAPGAADVEAPAAAG